MTDNTNWTPSPEGNKLNISDSDQINQIEAKGIALAEIYVFELDSVVRTRPRRHARAGCFFNFFFQ